MKVSVRKQNSVKIKENFEKYIIGLDPFKGYKDLTTRSSLVTDDKTRRRGSLTSMIFRSDV